MKTAISFVFAATLITAAGSVKAQQISNYASNVNPAYNNFPVTERNANALAVSEVNSAALSHFNSHNKSAEQSVWTANGKLQSVYFTQNGVKTRSTYNEKGKLEYTLRYLTLLQAPQQVRNLITNDYIGMSLIQITEVVRKGTRYHLVKMEDQRSILTIRVLNGETDVYEKIAK